jgi:hypothetical protein
MKALWQCKIGEVNRELLPPGADFPMRRAIAAEYYKLTGETPLFIFSGWGGELDASERHVVNEAPALLVTQPVHAVERSFMSGTREDVYDIVYVHPVAMADDMKMWNELGFSPWQIRPFQNMLDGRWHVTYRKTVKHSEIPFPLTLEPPPKR